jgi:hypothetical protein
MWVIEDHRALRAHIMPDHAGDRGTVSSVLAPHDHLHISQIRTLRGPAGMDSYATTGAIASVRSYAIMVLSCGQSRRGT